MKQREARVVLAAQGFSMFENYEDIDLHAVVMASSFGQYTVYCLEYDIFAVGDTTAKAIQNFYTTVDMDLKESFKRFHKRFDGLGDGIRYIKGLVKDMGEDEYLVHQDLIEPDSKSFVHIHYLFR